jgi:hypothetical protein
VATRSERGHLAEGLRAIGAVLTDDAQGRSRVPRRDGLELVDRLVEPVADVGPAESRVRGVIVAAAHQWMSRAPQ